jgi:hypothetical protein
MMKWIGTSLCRAYKPLCHAVLAWSLLLALPNAFAQDNSGNSLKNAKDKPFQDSMLASKGFGGDVYARNGINVFINGSVMPLRSFLVSYRGEKTDEKNVAYAFLLGVSDATEGKMWCSQEDYQPATVFKVLDEGLNQLKPSRHAERAAYVITEILEKKYPCKKERMLPKPLVQDGSAQDTKDEALQESILIEAGVAGERVIRQGADIFVPNLPMKRFMASYHNKQPEEQEVAYAFLLGVADATETKRWCSYRRFKTLTLLDTIHTALKKLNPSRYDERAAYVMTGIFADQYLLEYCKKER